MQLKLMAYAVTLTLLGTADFASAAGNAEGYCRSNPSACKGLRVNGKVQTDILGKIWNELTDEERIAISKEIDSQLNPTAQTLEDLRNQLNERLKILESGPVMRQQDQNVAECDTTRKRMLVPSFALCGYARSQGAALPLPAPSWSDCYYVPSGSSCVPRCDFVSCARP